MRSGLTRRSTGCYTLEECLDIFSANVRRLVPHLVSCVGEHDRFAVRKQARQFFGYESQKWVRLGPGQQQHWNANPSNRWGLDIGKESPSCHHHIPFVRIAQRVLASRLRPLVPRMGIVEDIVDKSSDPAAPIASAKP